MVHRATARERHEAESRTCLFAIFAGGRVVFLVHRFLWPGAVGEIRRWRLVSAGRLRQRLPARLTLERCSLGLVAAEQTAEAASIAELRRAEDRIIERIARLDRVVVGTGGTGCLALSEFAWREEPARFARILVFLLSGRDRSLAPRFVGIFRPVRSLHLGRSGCRRRQIDFWRNHQRRPLAIIDAPVFHIGTADAGHDALDDLFLEE